MTKRLYTEEDLRIAISKAFLEGIERPNDYGLVHETVIKSFIPIKLPSDEEIENESEIVYRQYPSNPKEHTDWKYGEDVNAHRKRKAFVKGAKWLKEQILNQNK